MSELNLLIECINTEGEAEDGGIKYIYMDADTIYRFENNRMKKISKTLINKARKQIQSQNTIRQLNQVQDDVAENSPPPKNVKKSKKSSAPIVEPPINEDDEYESADEEPVLVAKSIRKSKKSKQSAPVSSFNYSPNINLDEYYNNKNKMEYMNLEITRLNNKVDKLKQYKAIVNKLTGNEFDFDIPNQQQAQVSPQQPAYQQLQNTPARNDSLFLY